MKQPSKFLKKWLLPLLVGFVLLNACEKKAEKAKTGLSKAPGTPTDLVAEVKLNGNISTGDVMVSWKAPTDAGAKDDGTSATVTGYRVEHTSAADFSDASQVKTAEVSEAKATLNDLKALGTVWKIRVFAKNASKKPLSVASQALEVKVGEESSKATRPTPATQVTFSALSHTSIIANFTPSTDGGLKKDGITKANIIGYKLIINGPGFASSVVAENTVEDPAASSVSVAGLTASTTYYAALVTLSDNDDPDKRETFSQAENPQVITKAAPRQETAAATPPTPTVDTVSYRSFSVTVPAYTGTESQFGYADDGTTERTGAYKLELYDPNTDSWSDTGKGIATDQATTVTLDLLTAGTAYKVRIKAYPKEGENDVKESLQTTSTEVEVATKKITTPGTPQNLRVDHKLSTFDEIALKFDAPADDGGSPITNYYLYSSTSPITDITSDNVVLSTDFSDGSTTSSIGVNRHTTYYFALYTQNAVGLSQTPALLEAKNEGLVNRMIVGFSMLAKGGNVYKNHKLYHEDALVDTSKVIVVAASQELSATFTIDHNRWVSQNNTPKVNTDSVETGLSIAVNVPESQVSKYTFTAGDDENALRIESIGFRYKFRGEETFDISEKFQGDSEIVFSEYTSTTESPP